MAAAAAWAARTGAHMKAEMGGPVAGEVGSSTSARSTGGGLSGRASGLLHHRLQYLGRPRLTTVTVSYFVLRPLEKQGDERCYFDDLKIDNVDDF